MPLLAFQLGIEHERRLTVFQRRQQHGPGGLVEAFHERVGDLDDLLVPAFLLFVECGNDEILNVAVNAFDPLDKHLVIFRPVFGPAHHGQERRTAHMIEKGQRLGAVESRMGAPIISIAFLALAVKERERQQGALLVHE